MTDDDDWTVQIFVADGAAPAVHEYLREGGAVRHHSGPLAKQANKVVDVSVEALRANWQDTVAKLTSIGDSIDDKPSAWGVVEIEVGLTLSATGQLLFIAEASAEASVKFELAKRGAGAV